MADAWQPAGFFSGRVLEPENRFALFLKTLDGSRVFEPENRSTLFLKTL
jgi:hypothetical protein